MSVRSASRGSPAARSIRLALRTSSIVATSSASFTRCVLRCFGRRCLSSALRLAAISVMPFIVRFQDPPRADALNHIPIRYVNNVLSELMDGKQAYSADYLFNPDKGFSGCGFELIAELKVELGLERVDLVGGDGRDDVNEGVDDGSMLGQIEGRELLDLADVGHVPGLEQGFILQR